MVHRPTGVDVDCEYASRLTNDRAKYRFPFQLQLSFLKNEGEHSFIIIDQSYPSNVISANSKTNELYLLEFSMQRVFSAIFCRSVCVTICPLVTTPCNTSSANCSHTWIVWLTTVILANIEKDLDKVLIDEKFEDLTRRQPLCSAQAFCRFNDLFLWSDKPFDALDIAISLEVLRCSIDMITNYCYDIQRIVEANC